MREISCPRKGRRLTELDTYVDSMVNWLSNVASKLTVEECENDESVVFQFGRAFRTACSDAEETFAWVGGPRLARGNAQLAVCGWHVMALSRRGDVAG